MVLFSSSTVTCVCLSGGVKGEHFTFHVQFFPALDFECSRISNFRIALLLFFVRGISSDAAVQLRPLLLGGRLVLMMLRGHPGGGRSGGGHSGGGGGARA